MPKEGSVIVTLSRIGLLLVAGSILYGLQPFGPSGYAMLGFILGFMCMSIAGMLQETPK